MKIFLWSGTNPIAKAIQWFTDSEWSHTGFVLEDVKIIDSDWGILKPGVQVRHNKFKAYPHNYKEIELRLTKPQEARLHNIIHTEYINRFNYDYTLIWSFVKEWFEGDRFFDNMKHSKRAFTCSEFVAEVVSKVLGKDILPGRKPHTIRPHELEILECEEFYL